MTREEINLDIISKQYRKIDKAARGFKFIWPLIKYNEKEIIDIVLRNHRVLPIQGEFLVNTRDDIDFLIDYYSILEIGIIANYFPAPLPIKLTNEIKAVLGNFFINRYYSEYYPILLPQLIYKQITNDQYQFKQENSIEKGVLFEKFLILNHSLKNDEDIDQFLWFLDSRISNGYSIKELMNVLNNRNLIEYKLGRNNNHPLNKSLFGYIKYIQFLRNYAKLLRDSEKHKLLQSAFWHYQAYWFQQLRHQIGDIILDSLENIKKSVNSVHEDSLIKKKESFISNGEDFDSWKSSFDQIESIKEDIYYLLDQSLGEPIMSLLDK